MSVPRVLLSATILLAGAAWAADESAQGVKPTRPQNIVLIMADDLGVGELGCYGQKLIRTPRIDRLAAEGIRFTQFYSGSPVCAPARCCLLTGKHGGHAWVRTNAEVKPEGQKPLPAAEVTIAELLKAHGYATAAVGKWGLGMVGTDGDPNKQGFDFFYGYNCQRHAHNHYPKYLWRNAEREDQPGNTAGVTGEIHSHDQFEKEALRFIRENRDRPFFLYVPFAIPHVAIQVPEDSLAEYRGKWDDPEYKGGKGYQPHSAPRAGYAAMVTRMDRSVGRILDLLTELKLDDNTIVLFTSDNGPTHGGVGGSDSGFFRSAGELRGLKGEVYEGGLRVPLILRWPSKIKPGTVSDFASYFPDVLPTLAELAGARLPGGIDGVSLMPTLLDRPTDQRPHEFLIWEFHGYGGQQAIRIGNWKGVRTGLVKNHTAKLELYDLSSDPSEKIDVAAAHPAMVEKMLATLKSQRQPSPAFPFPPLDKPD